MANYMKKAKNDDPSIVENTELMDPKLKDTPIFLPDGVEVKVGMTIYTVRTKELGTYSYSEVKAWSGKIASELILNKVIAVNQGANARNFTVRSDRGCETTYSVRNNCLPELYGKKASAIAKMKKLNEKDIGKIDAKLQKLMVTVNQYQSTIKSLKKADFHV